jgi:hypothetical protein
MRALFINARALINEGALSGVRVSRNARPRLICAADNPRNIFSALAVLKKDLLEEKKVKSTLKLPQQATPLH